MNGLRDALLTKLRTLLDRDNLDSYDDRELPDLIGEDLIERLERLPDPEQERIEEYIFQTLRKTTPDSDDPVQRLHRIMRLIQALDGDEELDPDD